VAVTASARDYWVEEILRDGGSILIRAIRPDDKTRLLEHFRGLSARSVYFRFFGAKKNLSERELAAFTELDFARGVALVATLVEDGRERIIGVGRLSVMGEPGTSSRAEVAFAVADDHQGRGIGTLLLEHLAPIARALGITELQADVLGENRRMLEVFANSGFAVRRSIDSGVFTLTFPSALTPAFIEASLERERHAAAESVRAFLEPRAIAVVGASRDPNSIGGRVLANLRATFRHSIYAVHLTAAEVQGIRAFPRVSAIGAPVDLAVITVPAAAVEEVVADCAHAAVRSVIVISSGFGEVGPQDGKAKNDCGISSGHLACAWSGRTAWG
jgi:GNAT superfamily N-acetyltransferase/predicted CoA-binding protein